MQPWYELPSHRLWLQQQSVDLLDFGRNVVRSGGGASVLSDDGQPLVDQPVFTWITCRMVHVYSIGTLLGIPGSKPVAQGALAGLTGILKDEAAGGWFSSVAADGTPEADKSAYAHAFVLLAGTSATRAGLEGGRELLDAAIEVFEKYFWDEAAGKLIDTWSTDFSTPDPYRGINANMHGVEAMLTVADVTGDDKWLLRAQRVVDFVIEQAKAHNWQIPEHYDVNWNAELEYNDDQRDDQFKPYGVTIGHSLEWARLMLHLEASLDALSLPHGDYLGAATALFQAAVDKGWDVDGEPGFVYTTDWEGKPVVRGRMHWVAAEGIGAAAALWERTREQQYADAYQLWWDYVDTHLIDHKLGSWFHELDEKNVPAALVWPGKPDLYHAFQATLIPRLPLTPSLASAVAEGKLR
ncbi:AGE family epimerase/isomerase [Rarobacter incanus]|uniref:Mannose/cellobiose epimerase-like protein (N-acyl-D-glucosamine 2-epimerase family) n=1 Tax=Rarobacter incanus TaxID=153494 RepID=A0A542SNS1_9MICO|nr:AGE family epimerase/isomerase [Rarobacter incanus]TQK76270.1 mannose/cellobiose epimerase-like protein (N-acyl-D-glucosamine 2-epimerase family) [Rarobacter incanus]